MYKRSGFDVQLQFFFYLKHLFIVKFSGMVPFLYTLDKRTCMTEDLLKLLMKTNRCADGYHGKHMHFPMFQWFLLCIYVRKDTVLLQKGIYFA